MQRQDAVRLLRARGRCTAALIFSIFGTCWLLLSCGYSHHLRLPAVLPICTFGGLLVLAAMQVKQGQPIPVLEEALKAEKERDDRVFIIVNAITYCAVFLLFVLLPRFGMSNYVFPAFVGVVGLHFFPLPPWYRHTANLVVGAFMVVWSVFCAVAFKANGYTMAVYVTLGAGLALWSSALWALRAARRFFQEVALSGGQTDIH